MSNIEYYGVPYLDDAERKHYHRVQKKRAKRLAEQYEKNNEYIALAEESEKQHQAEAWVVYRKLRTERKYKNDLEMLKNIHNIFLP
jgi:hypothetical protein